MHLKLHSAVGGTPVAAIREVSLLSAGAGEEEVVLLFTKIRSGARIPASLVSATTSGTPLSAARAFVATRGAATGKFKMGLLKLHL